MKAAVSASQKQLTVPAAMAAGLDWPTCESRKLQQPAQLPDCSAAEQELAPASAPYHPG